MRVCGRGSKMRVQRADTARVAGGRAAFVWACGSRWSELVVAKKPPVYEHLPRRFGGWGERDGYETSLPSQDNSRTAVGGTGEINNARGDGRGGRMA